MGKKNKVKPPGAAREVGTAEVETKKTAVEVPKEVPNDPDPETVKPAEPESAHEPEAEKSAESEQEYPCVAPKVSIVGAGCVLVAGQKISPSDIHSDPDVAKEHFDSLVARGLILEQAPE